MFQGIVPQAEPPIEAQSSGTVDDIEVKEPDVPLEERFKHGTKEHDELLAKLIARRNLGERTFQDRHEAWDDVDYIMRGRIDLTRGRKLGDGSTDTTKAEMPVERSIVIPMSLAMQQVRLTQQCSILWGRTPELQVEGVRPNDIFGAKLMEAAVGYDLRQSRFQQVGYQLLLDHERYGVCVGYISFEKEYGFIQTPPPLQPGLLPKQMEKVAKKVFPGLFEWGQEWGMRREYGSVIPVDPRRFYMDPRVSVSNMQLGEFVGHGADYGYMWIVSRSQENDGPYFNTDAVKEFCGGKSEKRNRSGDSMPLNERADKLDKGSYSVDTMQVRLIPKEWKLSSETRPQLWWFTWVDDTTIIRVHASPYGHGEFTYGASESLPDWHSHDNPGFSELMVGMQFLVNWLYNVRVDTLRRKTNGALCYSPALIEEIDLLHPTPGGHVRMTQKAEELILRGFLKPDQIYAQINMEDTTVGHLQDAGFIQEQMQRMMAANDPSQGMLTADKRTLGEVQGITAASNQRIAHTFRLFDAQALSAIAKQMISNRQQFTTQEQWYLITGDLARELEKASVESGRINVQDGVVRALIGPDDMVGEYNYAGHSAAFPLDPQKSADTWMQILQAAAQIPQLSDPNASPDRRIVDLKEVANEMFRAIGVKNVEWYYMDVPLPPPMVDPMTGQPVQAGGPPTVVPDEQYAQQVAAGNYVG